MNLGSTDMTQKQKSIHHNGRLQGLWGQKWLTKLGARWKWYSQFSLITIRMHQKVKLLTRSAMLKFSVGCVMRCGASELHHGSEMTDSCTKTSPSIHLSNLVQNVLTKLPTSATASIHRTRPPVTFFLFSVMKMLLKGNRLQDMEEIS